MTSRIMENWRDDRRHSMKLVRGIKGRRSPLKDRIDSSIHRLKVQSGKMEDLTSKIRNHDKRLFKKCVESQVSNDSARAAMYAAECAELRKVAKTALASQLALEKIILRLETITQFGDIAAEMTPVSQAVSVIKDKVSGLMPHVSYELSEVVETLNESVLAVGESTNLEESFETQTEESQKILDEAQTIAEQRMQEHFPELPRPTRVLEDIAER